VIDADYKAKVAHQLAQYATADIHDLPPIYDYWSNHYLRPKLRSVLGIDTIPGFYTEHIRERAANAIAPPRILSIGAGDAELEVQIAEQLLAGGLREFRLECLELSPILIKKANQRIQQAGLQANVSMLEADLNAWRPERTSYTAVLANHILHHLVELEALFDNVALAIGDTGVFLTADMIGRNGHMRWPEALELVNALWDTMPDALKYNHVFLETDYKFRNWNCLNHGGFEGIRAEDILPLLVQRFQFEKFLGFGGLPEVFCNRVYGPNFDRDIPAHTRFIDSVEQLNATLLELGVIKPTMMFAVMSNGGVKINGGRMGTWKNLTPQFCVRNPENLDFSTHRQKSQLLATAFRPATLNFGRGGSGEQLLQSGWSYAEEWGTWMVATEAVIELPVPIEVRGSSTLTLQIRATAFIPRRLYCRLFRFQIGDAVIGSVTFARNDENPKSFGLELDTPAGDRFQLRILATEETFPEEDGCADRRPLGLALVDVIIS
jgi:SAM-dependent methyltransferase